MNELFLCIESGIKRKLTQTERHIIRVEVASKSILEDKKIEDVAETVAARIIGGGNV